MRSVNRRGGRRLEVPGGRSPCPPLVTALVLGQSPSLPDASNTDVCTACERAYSRSTGERRLYFDPLSLLWACIS